MSPRRAAGLSRPASKASQLGRWRGITTSPSTSAPKPRCARNQAAYLAEAQKLSHTGSFGWDLSTGEIFWSEETFRIFECDPATKPSIELVLGRIHPGDRAAKLQEAFDFEHRLLMPGGSVKTLRVVAHAVTDEPGKLQFVGAIMDVTERKKTEEALLYSEQRYHSLFQAMAASFWELDVSGVNELLRRLRDDGVVDFRRYFRENPDVVRQMLRATRVVDVNDQAVALFGRGCKRELLGNAEPFWPEESWQVYAEGVLSGVAGKPVYSAETRMRRLDGTDVDVLSTPCNLPTARRAGTVLVGIIDLSERNRAQYRIGARASPSFSAMAGRFRAMIGTRRCCSSLPTIFA